MKSINTSSLKKNLPLYIYGAICLTLAITLGVLSDWNIKLVSMFLGVCIIGFLLNFFYANIKKKQKESYNIPPELLNELDYVETEYIKGKGEIPAQEIMWILAKLKKLENERRYTESERKNNEQSGITYTRGADAQQQSIAIGDTDTGDYLRSEAVQQDSDTSTSDDDRTTEPDATTDSRSEEDNPRVKRRRLFRRAR